MTDRIDPGPGWRLLKMGEVKIIGDEYRDGLRWVATKRAGDKIDETSLPTRRRTAPRTTKSIATRATVRAAFRDGRIVTRMERNDSGLGEKEMRATIETWDLAPLIGVKYIMLEIQRKGEP